MATLIVPAFVAGIITFLAPCTLPLVPGYLGYISGTSVGALKEPSTVRTARGKIFRTGFFFVLGFSTVFILLGSLVGLGGQFLLPYRAYISRIGGALIILLGLALLGVFKLPILNQTAHLRVSERLRGGSPRGAFIFGAAFGFGWTPCVGPILGSVLLLAASTATVLQGALLLAVFSAGLALPFLIVAAAIGHATRFIQSFSRFLPVVEKIGGALLVLLGFLMLTDRFALWISWAYRLLGILNYDRLLNYL